MRAIIILATTLLAAGCGGRTISFTSDPAGTAIETTYVEAHTTTSRSFSPGTATYDHQTGGLANTLPSVQSGTSTTHTVTRKVIGYTPFTIGQWNDSHHPSDYTVAKKGGQRVVFFVREGADVHIDWEARPIIVRGASRILESSRPAEAR